MRSRFAILAGLAAVVLGANATSADELQVGDAFPRLQLPSLEDGRPASIGDFAGRKLMLHVWASW